MQAKRKVNSLAQQKASRVRAVRVFLSSTFRDFGEERDLLVRQVFPALRAKLKERFVEIVDVDLRWGITVQQAERGEVLPICLAEIDRARPYFVGMLGERYGWIPPTEGYAPTLLERQPWLKKHQGGKSVTELEILHGVLNNPKMEGRAFFYFRSATYAKRKGGDYLQASAEDAARQRELKARIRKAGFAVVAYRDPQAFAKRLEKDLWELLDAEFPVDAVPDAFEQEAMRHEAYAAPRRRLYLGGDRYRKALGVALTNNRQWVLIEGESGAGKSALIANWLAAYRQTYPKDQIHEHYLGASADAADPYALVRRLIVAIQRTTQSSEEIQSDPQAMLDSLASWLATANAWAAKHRTRWVIVLDALNGLTELRDLRWLPAFLPPRVHLVVSCLSGEVLKALEQKAQGGASARIAVKPLTVAERKTLLVTYLARFNKTLPANLLKQVLGHALAANPLFLRTLAEELRIFGVHEELEERVGHYLQSATVDDLFERVLARVEGDCGKQTVRQTMTAIWASRAGLTEEEILGIAKLVPATWAPIRNALDESLLDSNGRLTFAHDYLRIGVCDRYLATQDKQRAVHRQLAAWFRERPADARRAQEEPYQWREAKSWTKLKACLTERPMFEVLNKYVSYEDIWGYWLALEANTRTRVERAYEQAWRSWKTHKSDEETGYLAYSVANFLQYAGRFGRTTEQLFRLSLSISEKTLGPQHSRTGACLHDLANLLGSRGDYAAAEPLYRRALSITERKVSQEPDTKNSELWTILNDLAQNLYNQGDFDAAEPLLRRSLANSEKVNGSVSRETSMVLLNLANLQSVQGDNKAAELTYRRALNITEKTFGPDHPHTSLCVNNLACLLCDMGDYVVAESLHQRALAIAEKALGPEHPSTGIVLRHFAYLRQDQRKWGAAESLYKRALNILEKALGPEHYETGFCLFNLSGVLEEVGQYEVAESYLRRSIVVAEKVDGPDSTETKSRLKYLVELLRKKGDYAAAKPLLERVLSITEKTEGPDDPSTGTSLNDLATLLKDMGDYVGAKPLYRRALAIAEKAQGPEHPVTGKRLNNLAALLQRMGEYAAAKPLYRRALEIAEKVQGPEHPTTGTRLNNLALLLKDMGDYGAAESLFRRALEIAEKAQGPEHPVTGKRLNNLAALLQDMGDYAAAEPMFRRALAIAEKAEGP